MKPKKPYLLRAVHEWIVDNGLTPHIMVDATQPDVHVVEEYIQNGRIVLNIDTDAIDNLHLDDESVSFTAYFGSDSQAYQIFVPMHAILAIFAQEISDGITFEAESPKQSLVKRMGAAAKKKMLQKVAVKHSKKMQESSQKTTDSDVKAAKKSTQSHLKIVK